MERRAKGKKEAFQGFRACWGFIFGAKKDGFFTLWQPRPQAVHKRCCHSVKKALF